MTASTVTKKDFADALAKQHHLTKKQGREMLEDLIGMAHCTGSGELPGRSRRSVLCA